MKKLSIIFFLSFLVFGSFAQTVDWVNHAGGVNDDGLTDMISDSSGNFFVTGQLGNNADFNGTSVEGGLFIAKYDSGGVQQWVVAYGDTNSCGKGICLDQEGNIYVVGWMDSSMQVGDTFLTNLGEHDMVFMKFSSSGNLMWVKQFGGSKSDKALKIVCDENDHLYLTGFFSESAMIGNFPVNATSEYSDIFLARSDTAGNILWIKTAGSPGEDQCNSLALDASGNIFITGVFEQTASFNGTLITSKGNDDFFVAKYDTAGIFQWVRSAGSTENDKGLAICTASNGNCYVTGNFQGTIYFGTYQLSCSPGNRNLFVATYSPGGICGWAKQGSGNGIERGASISLNDEGKLLVGGAFENSMNISGAYLYSGGGKDIFTARFDSAGFFETAQRAGGYGEDGCIGIVPEKNNRIIAGGYFSENSTFGNYSLTSNGGEDAMIVSMYMNELSITSLSDSSLCPGQSFDIYFTVEGTFLPGNVFTAQLSSSTGNFTTFSNIGSLNSTYSGVVHAVLPLSVSASNNYRIRISSNNSQCYGMFNLPVNIHTNPYVTVTGNTSLCSGDSLELIAAGALNYNWIPSGSLTNAVNDSVVAFPNVTTIYNITGTDQYGCIGGTSKTITVYNAIPYVGISAGGTTNICAGQTVWLSANYVSGTTYQWQLDGSNIPGAVNYTYTANQGGIYTCIATNPCGYNTSNAITLIVNPKPVVTIGSFLPACQNSPAFTLSGGLPLGGIYSGSYTYNGIFTPSTVGTFNINYTYTDSNSCSNIATAPVQVLANPSVTWGTVTTAWCETALPFTLTGGTPAGGVYSGTGVSNGIFDPAMAGLGTHVLTYKYTNVSGCYKSVTKSFVVSAMPTISFTMDTFICLDEPGFTLTGGLPTGGSYYINGSPNSFFNPAVLGAGMQQVVYKRVTGSCTAYDTVMVQVEVCAGVNEVNPSQKFILYPNPSPGIVQLETNMSGEKLVLQVFDALGKAEKEFYFSGNEKTPIQLDLRNLPAGIYSVQLSNDELRWTKMLVIE